MKKNFFFYLFVFTFFLINNLNSKIENSIIVKVDNKIITNFEIKNKILSTLIINQKEINQNNIDNLKSQALENLIFFRLKEIELEKYNFEVNNQRLNDYLNRFSKNNIQKLKTEFKNYDLDFNLWKKELEVELKWQQFIYFTYSNKIKIDENSLDANINKALESNNNNIEVNLSEIEVFQNNKVSNEVLISRILDDIQNIGFENTALKYSVSNTSSNKGNLGWINLNSLSKRISDTIINLKPGEISKPLIQTNNILFLKLNSKRKSQGNNINKDKLRKNLIERKRNELFNLYSNSHLSKLKNNYLIEYK